MQNKPLLIFLLLLAVLSISGAGYAQQSNCSDVKSVRTEHFDADDYAELQQNAPEQLQIKIVKIVVRRSSRQNDYSPKFLKFLRGLPPVLKADYVDIEAKVIKVQRSKFGLKNESFIKIYYTTNQNYVIGNLENWEAISPPLPEVGSIYTMYLKRVQLSASNGNEEDFRYVPVAYSKSFAEVKVETANK